MTNRTTKRALLSSLLALVLCFTMLIGTTFAWFTDSVTSSGNVIKSGTLDVQLLMHNGTDYIDISDNTAPIFGEGAIAQNNNAATIWEPGKTQVAYLAIKNNGNLALKYTVALDVENVAKDLYEVMTYEIVPDAKDGEAVTLAGGNAVAEGLQSVSGDVSLAVGATHYFALAIHMDENTGNDYQDGQVNFSLRVLATQDVAEADSFDNKYDTDATYPVFASTAGELKNALANAKPGTVVTLSENVEYGTVEVAELKDVVIKGAAGSPIIFKTDADSKIENVTLEEVEFEYTGATVDCGVVIDANAQIDNLVIDGCTFVGTGAKAGRGLSGYNNNASIVFKNCTFKDLGYPMYAWGGFASLTIDNCTFDNIKSWAIMPQSGFNGDLTVNNCTFVNCLGGGLVKAGTLTAGHTFTFTNNTITGCTVSGDHNWFQFNVSAGTAVINNNTKDGQAWTPGVADGLK